MITAAALLLEPFQFNLVHAAVFTCLFRVVQVYYNITYIIHIFIIEMLCLVNKMSGDCTKCCSQLPRLEADNFIQHV